MSDNTSNNSLGLWGTTATYSMLLTLIESILIHPSLRDETRELIISTTKEGELRDSVLYLIDKCPVSKRSYHLYDQKHSSHFEEQRQVVWRRLQEVSIGMVCFTPDKNSLDSLIKYSDNAHTLLCRSEDCSLHESIEESMVSLLGGQWWNSLIDWWELLLTTKASEKDIILPASRLRPDLLKGAEQAEVNTLVEENVKAIKDGTFFRDTVADYNPKNRFHKQVAAWKELGGTDEELRSEFHKYRSLIFTHYPEARDGTVAEDGSRDWGDEWDDVLEIEV